MSEPVTFFDTAPSGPTDAVVELFDPPMCCSTGVCGPTIDQALLDVNQMVLQLQAAGVQVARYQIASHSKVFAKHPDVMRLVREQQMAALPITVVRGRVIASGRYPTAAEVNAALDGTA